MFRHLIRFYSGESLPTIIYRQGEEIGKMEVSGKQYLEFSEKLFCIGFRSMEGYFPCPHKAQNTSQCRLCSFRDISKAYTRGDFSGYPELYEEAQKEEYVLYLAGFGHDLVKCGVTRKDRFALRMLEQGADFGCILASFAGPDEVYFAEAQFQSRFQLCNSVRISQKIRRLEFDHSLAKKNFSEAVCLVRESGILNFDQSPIIDFSSHYPRVRGVEEKRHIDGKVLGAKGEILLFESGGRHFAVNMRKKVGSFF